MNRFKKFALLLALAPAAFVAILAARTIYNQALVNETGLAYSNTYTLDMGNSILSHSNIDSLSMQAVYSSTTFSAVTFTDGVASTGTVTISSYPALVGAQATNTLTVKSTTTIANLGVSFTLNGYQFLYGDQWSVGTTTQATASNICTAITTYGGTNGLFTCSTAAASGGVVTITVISSGTLGNSYTLATSSDAALQKGAATFSGGKDHAVFILNGTSFTQGADFSAVTSSAATAINLKNAINASSAVNTTVSASTSADGIVSITASQVGARYNYSMISSTPSAMVVTNKQLYGGADTLISTTSNSISVTNHALTTGLAVLYTKTAGTNPANLSENTTYYAIRVDANTFKLATSKTNATAGTNITIATQAAAGGGTFVLTPLAITGTPSFKWQRSNDNSNWEDIAVSTITMSSFATATTVWDFHDVGYRYIRLNVVGPTTGGISLVVTGVGKSKS